MNLGALVKEIAGMLGSSWRLKNANGVPVITHRRGWLVFDDTDENKLHITFMHFDGGSQWCEMPHGLGIGETTRRIREQLVYRHPEPADDAEERLHWHDDWCALFTAWAQEQDFLVEFTADVHEGRILSLRADFGSDARIVNGYIACARDTAWGSITVTYDSFPAKVEHFTTKAAIVERLGVVEQRVIGYTPRHGDRRKAA